MKRILKGKFRALDLAFLLLLFYPLLKFNFSSLLFIVFCIFSLGYSLKNKQFYFTKSNFKIFLLTALYFFLLVVSITYSEDKGKGVQWMSRLLPLLLVPLVLLFFRPTFSEKIRTKALNIFLIVNILYILILTVVFLFKQHSEDLALYNSGAFLRYDKIQFVLNSAITGDLLFVHKAYFSMGFVLSAIFSLQRANHYFREKFFPLYFSLFLFFSLLVVYTFSFPNVIALVVCVLLFIALELKKGTLKIKKTLFSMTFLIGIVVFSVFYFSKDLDVKRGISFVTSVLSQKEVEGNDPRIEIYKTYNNLLQKARPRDVIFGYGIGDEQKVLHRELEKRIRENKNKNLLFFNEEFNNESWFRNNLTVVSNQIVAPGNGKTADLLVATNSTEKVSRNISTSLVLDKNEVYTFSVYAKRGSATGLIMRLGDLDNRAYFNLKDGNISKYSGIKSAEIEALKDDWFRCSITVKGEELSLAVLGVLGPDGTYNYKGSEGNLYLWGAQIEQRSAVSSYIKNGSELMEYAYNENLNSHNNYLFFLINGGIISLGAFLLSLGVLFYIGFKNLNSLQLSFCVIIALNFLTENILSRHWGLMFVSVLILILFSATKTEKNAEESL